MNPVPRFPYSRRRPVAVTDLAPPFDFPPPVVTRDVITHVAVLSSRLAAAGVSRWAMRASFPGASAGMTLLGLPVVDGPLGVLVIDA